MFTLIKREIEILAPFFIILIIAILAVIFKIVTTMDNGSNTTPLGIHQDIFYSFWITLGVIPAFYALLGALQVHSDRHSKALVFLSTLATTRSRLFAAKVIAGLCCILITFIPLMIAYLACFNQIAPHVLNLSVLTLKLAVILFLADLACYNLGLLLGWTSGIFIFIFGSLALAVILVLIIGVKGLTFTTAFILLLAAAAALALNWLKFKTIPLA